MGLTQRIGAIAERHAAEYLREQGFEVCHTNWRSGRYELDIVARKDDTLHFVEVKCRREGALTSPEDAITPTKFRSLQKAAEAYIHMYGVELEVQFDLIAVDHSEKKMKIRYIANAMTPAW